MKHKALTQRDKILAHFEKYGSITPLDALREFGCMQLPARIFELKEGGYKIKTVIEKSKNKSGGPTHYARYYLQEDI